MCQGTSFFKTVVIALAATLSLSTGVLAQTAPTNGNHYLPPNYPATPPSQQPGYTPPCNPNAPVPPNVTPPPMWQIIDMQCLSDGTMVIKVRLPSGAIDVHYYRGGCAVSGTTGVVRPGGGLYTSGTCQITGQIISIDANVVLLALRPGGTMIGSGHLTCSRVNRPNGQSVYSCTLRLNGPTGDVIRQWDWSGQPERYILGCAQDAADALDNFIDTNIDNLREWCKKHDPKGTIQPDGEGGLCARIEFKF